LKDDVPSQIKEFSRGPSNVAKRFSSYLINGNRSHTMKQKMPNTKLKILVSWTSSIAISKDENPKK